MSMLLSTRATNNSTKVSPLSPFRSLILSPFLLPPACRKGNTVIPAVVPTHRVLNRLYVIFFRNAIGSLERDPRKCDPLIIVLIPKKSIRIQRQVLQKFETILRYNRCQGQMLTEVIAPERGHL